MGDFDLARYAVDLTRVDRVTIVRCALEVLI